MGTFEIVSLVTIVYAFANFLKYVKNADVNGIVTQLSVWAGGIGAAFLFAHSDFGASITVGKQTLDQLNGVSLLIFGLGIGATAAAGHDVKKALDNGDTAKTKPLIASPSTYSE